VGCCDFFCTFEEGFGFGLMLTLAVITRNEADRIAACLASVPMATEILVLDSGSSDATVAVAKHAGACVLETGWPGFTVQRNRALNLATQPWVLFLDADERLSPKACEQLGAFLASDSRAVGASFPRKSRWQGAWIQHGRWYPDKKVRLLRNGSGEWIGDGAHERLHLRGRCFRFSGDILHDPYRNIMEHVTAINTYTRLQARVMASQGRPAPLWRLAFGPPFHVVDSLLFRRGMLDGWRGVGLASLGAVNVGLKWARLRRAQR
jgi:glycosyltransferase involved in cell wall biosynthesis